MKLQRKYNRVLRILRKLPAEDFYSVLSSLEDGYLAYKTLEPCDSNPEHDDIEDLEEEIDD